MFIFHPEAREYYHLERLWTDGTNDMDLGLEQEPAPDQNA